MGLFDIGPLSSDIKEYYDFVIIGAGPAGLTAAIYARRAGLTALVIEKALEGGAVTQTHVVENWPGEISIEGQALGQKFADHAKHFGAEFHYAYAQKVTIDGEYKIVELDDGHSIRCKVLIVATGTQPRKLGVPGEAEFRGKGVTYCAACDGYLFKDKDVDLLQKRVRMMINGLASCGLNASQVNDKDLRVILDNFLNGGKTTEFGTVMPV